MLALVLISTASIGLLLWLWLLTLRTFSYWERKGFPYLQPSIPLGNLQGFKRSFGMTIYDLYTNSREKFVGIYFLFRPTLLVRDAQLVHDILTKDFASFHDRGIYVNEKDPISANLFALKGQSWRSLRSKLTPAFSSGKLKTMFATIRETGEKMQDYLDGVVGSGEGGTVVEMKDFMLRYTNDIIGSVIFGLDINSFENPDNEFRKLGKETTKKSFFNAVRVVAAFLIPKLFEILPISTSPPVVTKFLLRLVRETIDYREKNNYSRKDLMQSLIQLRNTGKVNLDDSIWDVETAAESLKSMSVEQIAAQAFVFYIAGNETSASTIAFCLHELAQNPHILEKAQADVKKALQAHDGEMSYECIQDMAYLELCIMETIRKYPGLPILNRECTQDYPIPNSDLTIEKGTGIVISLMGLHRDPQHFPNPLKFDPERFRDGSPLAYIPFGEGPRQCIAFRLGKVNAKVALAMVLMKFDISCEEKKEIEFDNFSVGLMPKGGIHVKLAKKLN